MIKWILIIHYNCKYLSQIQNQTQHQHQESTHNNTSSTNTGRNGINGQISQSNQELNNFDLDILDEDTIKLINL